MVKQINEPVAHHPSTVAEIRQTRSVLFDKKRALQSEGAEIFAAMKAGAPPPRPLSDHERRVTAHIQQLMNGSTPPHLLATAVSRDEQIRVELDAIDFVDRELGRQQEAALEREALQWVRTTEAEWRALCREIVLAAVRLEALEEKARNLLGQMPPWPVHGLAMGSSIGSGLSLLGICDPLSEMKLAALADGVVTSVEIRKAQHG